MRTVKSSHGASGNVSIQTVMPPGNGMAKTECKPICLPMYEIITCRKSLRRQGVAEMRALPRQSQAKGCPYFRDTTSWN